VVEGRVRAKQRRFQDKDRKLGIADPAPRRAALCRQGAGGETLNLSQLPGYKTGGTIHIVVNNQIPASPPPRSTDDHALLPRRGKMIEVPIFHVTARIPRPVVYVGGAGARLPRDVGQDVVIDMVCYAATATTRGRASLHPAAHDKKIRDRPGIQEIYTSR